MNDLTRYRLRADLHVPASAKLLYCCLLDMIGIVSRHSEDGGRLSNQYLIK
jgi:hypothetical protein